jgi:DNA (cytosine-5)-methyltransferase 1
MSLRAYYNDNDKIAAAWLRELIKDGLIADGDVDDRSIADVRGADLRGYGQCHFFAGIGAWSYALRLAGVPDDAPVWTGSCPCQPLSVAGKRKGHEDERHLWPEFFRIIDECRPSTVFGEQVAGKDGLEWLSGVQADLEDVGYAVARACLNAAGVGAPHIRQRLYWMAHTESGKAHATITGQFLSAEGGTSCRMADRAGTRREAARTTESFERNNADSDCTPVRMAYSGHGQSGRSGGPDESHAAVRCSCEIQPSGCSKIVGMEHSETSERERPVGEANNRWRIAESGGPSFAHWADSYAHYCTDGKYRRVPAEPAFFPLVDDRGKSGRVGLLRGAGNSIVPQVAAVFIEEVMNAIAETQA